MDSVLSKKKKLHRRRRRVWKSSSSRRRNRGYIHRPHHGIGNILWIIIMESQNVYNSSMRGQRNCQKSSTKRERRKLSRIFTIRIGWKMVVWFYEMLLLSAKCPRPPGGWENSVWKAISWNHVTSTPSPSRNKWDWWESSAQNFFFKKRGRLPYCYNQDWMKNGGLILWNAIATCEMSETSWRMGKLPSHHGSENHLKGPVIPFGAMVEYHPISTRDQSRLLNLVKTVLPGFFLGMHWSRRELGKETFWLQTLKIWRKTGRIGHLSSKNQCKRSIDATKERRFFHYQWQMVQQRCQEKRLRVPSTETNRKERRSQWRTSWRTGRASTDRINKWRWSPKRLLVDPRWLHLSSSQWTSSSTLYVEGRHIPNSTEIHWCCQVHSIRRTI